LPLRCYDKRERERDKRREDKKRQDKRTEEKRRQERIEEKRGDILLTRGYFYMKLTKIRKPSEGVPGAVGRLRRL
jgi:hypothetical protein